MSTTNSIGTSSRDYSTLQAWEDAVPATPTSGYIGECYNDAEFTAGVVIAGHTTSAANFIRLTCAAGQSFQDNANVRSNALFYNAANGVAVAANPFSAPVIDVQNDFVEIRRLQIKRTGASYGTPAVNFTAGQTSALIKDCIVQKSYSATDSIVVMRESKAVNVVAIETGGGGSTGFAVANFGAGPGTLINCTSVRSSALGASGTGCAADATYTNSETRGCASFGWTTGFSATGWNAANCSRNATDASTAPGSNNQVSKTFANQFVDTTNDFRLKAGSDCIDTGNTDATNAPNDISGTVRGVGTAGDIGVWEFVAAAAAFVLPPQRGQVLMIQRERVLQKGGGRSEAYSSLRGQPFAVFLPVDNTPQPSGAQNVPSPVRARALPITPFKQGPRRGFPVAASIASALNNYVLNTATGTYVVTGIAAGLLTGRLLNGAAGSYTHIGQSAAVLKGSLIKASPGAYALTGVNASLLRGLLLTASPGSYIISGRAAALLKASLLNAAPGGYVLSGRPAAVLAGRVIPAAAGGYGLSGAGTTLLAARVIFSVAGVYLITGPDAALDYSAAIPNIVGDFLIHARRRGRR